MGDSNPDSGAVNGELASPTVESTGQAAVAKSNAEDAAKPSSTTVASPTPPLLKKQPSWVQQSPSGSPRTSRNASPIRKDGRPQPLSTPSSSQPSAAAIQRALSAANAPQLQAAGVADGVSKLPKASKSGGGSGDTTPRWPTSPRLKSPPPSGANSRRGSAATQKQAEGSAPPSISVQGATPESSTPPPAKQAAEEPPKVQQLQTPVKGPLRGPSGKSTLETVQEISTDDTREPSPAAVQAAADLRPLTTIPDDDATSLRENEKHTQNGESGSESASTKSDKKKDQGTSTARPKNASTKSYNPLTSTKSRQEGKQGMTVETETVQSIPQSAINAGDRSGTRNDNSGSIRTKPSTETIRPKKERKKPSAKTRISTQGTASSKADIFEARVANAVEDANSSDSDETFVYESNPPEAPRRPVRHHSRTPSVTSSHSVAEGQRSAGMRNFGDAIDDRRVAGKRSMKFSNNAYNDIDSPETKDGSVRSHTPRHFGRFGRGGSQASMFDPDSPFTQASKLRSNQLDTRNSRPNSPRSAHGTPNPRASSTLFGKKSANESSYDFDAEGGDENERTPLMGTVRKPRSVRLPPRLGRQNTTHEIDEYYGVRRHSRCGKYGGCFLFLVVLAAVIVSAIAFLVMSNRPLYDVQVCKIENVLASEQELILDLVVGAVNPNALGIKVDDMDVNLFARSKHVGSGSGDEEKSSRGSSFRRKRRRSEVSDESWRDWFPPWPDSSTSGGVDEGTDPPDDDDLEKDAQTMLLGHVLHFDQGLSFEGSPLERHLHSSVGELSLAKPGNTTETGGSARWEKVLTYEFELIVRGVLKYQLPISSRLEKARINSNIMVYPDDGDGDGDGDGEADLEWRRRWRYEVDDCRIDPETEVRGERGGWWFGR